MADAGIGEAMLISAAVGGAGGVAGTALSGGNLEDSLKGGMRGAVLGGLTGGATAGLGSVMGALSPAASVAGGALSPAASAAGGVGSTGAGVGAGLESGAGTLGGLGNTAAVGSAANPFTFAGTGAGTGAGFGTGVGANAGTLGGLSSAGTAGGLSATPAVSPNVFGVGPQSNMALGALGAGAGLTSAMNYERDKYAPPGIQPYTGILSKYDPYSARGVEYPTRMASDGGIMHLAVGGLPNNGTVEEMSRQNAIGGNQMFPQAGLGSLTGANRFQNATNTPMETNVVGPTDTMTNPYSGQMSFARGGIATGVNDGVNDVLDYNIIPNAPNNSEHYAKARNSDFINPFHLASGGITSLGHFSDGGQLLKGPGDGMSDDIPAQIGKHQPARLADGEFVIPADVVSHLGNGSTDAGAKHLYSMMNKVRKARTGNPKQGKQINPNKYLTS